jgi:DNA-binding NarL/FixJ family response regulator
MSCGKPSGDAGAIFVAAGAIDAYARCLPSMFEGAGAGGSGGGFLSGVWLGDAADAFRSEVSTYVAGVADYSDQLVEYAAQLMQYAQNLVESQKCSVWEILTWVFTVVFVIVEIVVGVFSGGILSAFTAVFGELVEVLIAMMGVIGEVVVDALAPVFEVLSPVVESVLTVARSVGSVTDGVVSVGRDALTVAEDAVSPVAGRVGSFVREAGSELGRDASEDFTVKVVSSRDPRSGGLAAQYSGMDAMFALDVLPVGEILGRLAKGISPTLKGILPSFEGIFPTIENDAKRVEPSPTVSVRDGDPMPNLNGDQPDIPQQQPDILQQPDVLLQQQPDVMLQQQPDVMLQQPEQLLIQQQPDILQQQLIQQQPEQLLIQQQPDILQQPEQLLIPEQPDILQQQVAQQQPDILQQQVPSQGVPEQGLQQLGVPGVNEVPWGPLAPEAWDGMLTEYVPTPNAVAAPNEFGLEVDDSFADGPEAKRRRIEQDEPVVGAMPDPRQFDPWTPSPPSSIPDEWTMQRLEEAERQRALEQRSIQQDIADMSDEQFGLWLSQLPDNVAEFLPGNEPLPTTSHVTTLQGPTRTGDLREVFEQMTSAEMAEFAANLDPEVAAMVQRREPEGTEALPPTRASTSIPVRNEVAPFDFSTIPEQDRPVFRLVAEGLSNAEIAAARKMELGDVTLEIQHIKRKIGVSRAQLGTFAMEGRRNGGRSVATVQRSEFDQPALFTIAEITALPEYQQLVIRLISVGTPVAQIARMLDITEYGVELLESVAYSHLNYPVVRAGVVAPAIPGVRVVLPPTVTVESRLSIARERLRTELAQSAATWAPDVPTVVRPNIVGNSATVVQSSERLEFPVATGRQAEVLRLTSEGVKSNRIAELMNTGVSFVRIQLSAGLKRSGITRLELGDYARVGFEPSAALSTRELTVGDVAVLPYYQQNVLRRLALTDIVGMSPEQVQERLSEIADELKISTNEVVVLEETAYAHLGLRTTVEESRTRVHNILSMGANVDPHVTESASGRHQATTAPPATRPFAPPPSGAVVRPFDFSRIKERYRPLYRYVAEGLTNPEIADVMKIKPFDVVRLFEQGRHNSGIQRADISLFAMNGRYHGRTRPNFNFGSDEPAGFTADQISGLPYYQQMILRLVATGTPVEQIARRLDLPEYGVELLERTAYRNLNYPVTNAGVVVPAAPGEQAILAPFVTIESRLTLARERLRAQLGVQPRHVGTPPQ